MGQPLRGERESRADHKIGKTDWQRRLRAHTTAEVCTSGGRSIREKLGATYLEKSQGGGKQSGHKRREDSRVGDLKGGTRHGLPEEGGVFEGNKRKSVAKGTRERRAP